MRTSLAIGMWVLFGAVLVPPADAQGRRGGAAPPQTLNTEGLIQGARPGMLQVSSERDGDWLVTIPREAESVVFRATTTAEFLQPGLAVRFHATFRKTDKRQREYTATRPVSALDIITVLPHSLPGMYPDDAGGLEDGMFRSGADQPDAELRQAEPAAQPRATKPADPKPADTADDRDKSPPRERGRAAARETAPSTADELPVLVIGVLREYKNNRLKVNAGNALVIAELPETAEVSVDVRHCEWVRPGDKIELTARFYPALRGRAEGQRFTITASQPLAPDEKASKGRRRASREKKPDEADERDGNKAS